MRLKALPVYAAITRTCLMTARGEVQKKPLRCESDTTSLFPRSRSWLCYYKSLQIGEASKVIPIDKLSVVITLVLAFVFLHEEFTTKSLIGCILIGAGTLVMVL